MPYSRGEVVIVLFPFTHGRAAKGRPAIVVHSDAFPSEFQDCLLVPVTSQVRRARPEFPYRILVSHQHPDFEETGLLQDSVLMAEKVASTEGRMIQSRIGVCSETIMTQVDDALRMVLGL